jgi:hypothetical protein
LNHHPQTLEQKGNNPFRKWYPLLKWVISVASLVYFGWLIYSQDKAVIQQFKTRLSEAWHWMLIILVLAFFNWFFESIKLSILLRNEMKAKRSFWLKTVLSGTAISNFTPARTGEYLGRSLYLKTIHPVRVVIATVTGNIAQVLTTYILGLLALQYLLLSGNNQVAVILLEYKVTSIVITSLILLLFLIFGKRIVLWILSKLPKRVAKLFNIIRYYNAAVFTKVWLFAVLRYATFSIQFFLLLQVFSGFKLAISKLVFIPFAYLLQSLVPVPAVADVGVRVMVSKMLFDTDLSQSEITLGVTALWFINLILPGILGALVLLFSARKK